MWIPGDQNVTKISGVENFAGNKRRKSTRLCIKPLIRPFTTTEKELLMLLPWAFTTTEALSKPSKLTPGAHNHRIRILI
jgi:hypothetical protein